MSLTLRQIALVAERLQPVLEDLQAVLGIGVCHVDPQVEVFGLENSLLPVGTNFIEVVAPIRENTAGGRYLKRRGGDGGYMIITQADSLATQESCRARARQMGIRVVWESAHDTGRFMQLHPADTGGSFLEIDWDEKNEHQGNWPPAGGTGWQEAVRTDVVSSIMAAQLQSPDPTALARRWSTVLDIPLTQGPAGAPQIALNNAAIRFVKARDGRGEGLGALDIRAADPARLLEAAQERGLKISDTEVMLCGMRFNLV